MFISALRGACGDVAPAFAQGESTSGTNRDHQINRGVVLWPAAAQFAIVFATSWRIGGGEGARIVPNDPFEVRSRSDAVDRPLFQLSRASPGLAPLPGAFAMSHSQSKMIWKQIHSEVLAASTRPHAARLRVCSTVLLVFPGVQSTSAGERVRGRRGWKAV